MSEITINIEIFNQKALNYNYIVAGVGGYVSGVLSSSNIVVLEPTASGSNKNLGYHEIYLVLYQTTPNLPAYNCTMYWQYDGKNYTYSNFSAAPTMDLMTTMSSYQEPNELTITLS